MQYLWQCSADWAVNGMVATGDRRKHLCGTEVNQESQNLRYLGSGEQNCKLQMRDI
jgi:hypothetical protein